MSSSMESSSSQGGLKSYLCRHTCGCKLRHSTDFTRSSVSSQGALWYHEHNETLHPRHNAECEYEQHKSTRKSKDGKDKKDIKMEKEKNRQLASSSTSSINLASSTSSIQELTAGNVNSSNFMPIQPQQNFNSIYPKLIFQPYPKNTIGNGKFNSQGISILNNGNENIPSSVRQSSSSKENSSSGSPPMSMNDKLGKNGGLYSNNDGKGGEYNKRKSSLQDDSLNKRTRMDGIAYSSSTEEIISLKTEIKELQNQIEFMKLQYIDEHLANEKGGKSYNTNNVNLLSRIVPQFLHDVWFKNCKSSDDYQKRIIEILSTIIKLFDPESKADRSVYNSLHDALSGIITCPPGAVDMGNLGSNEDKSNDTTNVEEGQKSSTTAVADPNSTKSTTNTAASTTTATTLTKNEAMMTTTTLSPTTTTTTTTTKSQEVKSVLNNSAASTTPSEPNKISKKIDVLPVTPNTNNLNTTSNNTLTNTTNAVLNTKSNTNLTSPQKVSATNTSVNKIESVENPTNTTTTTTAINSTSNVILNTLKTENAPSLFNSIDNKINDPKVISVSTPLTTPMNTINTSEAKNILNKTTENVKIK